MPGRPAVPTYKGCNGLSPPFSTYCASPHPVSTSPGSPGPLFDASEGLWIRASLWHASRRMGTPGVPAQLSYRTMRAPAIESLCAALSRPPRPPTSERGTPDPGTAARRLPYPLRVRPTPATLIPTSGPIYPLISSPIQPCSARERSGAVAPDIRFRASPVRHAGTVPDIE